MRPAIAWMCCGYLVLVLFGNGLSGWVLGVGLVSYGMGIAVRDYREGGSA